eukprot:TRINITY_DN5853_c0_g1_i3.p1 TRINITY_DN5853_c0_g1~~TRINITY_DN5853_c0_g1_i3.p1  ORF type:complete len:721 (+),score=153.25 TRINITY_DN5853_c0_g1_i3:26-2188(+)
MTEVHTENTSDNQQQHHHHHHHSNWKQEKEFIECLNRVRKSTTTISSTRLNEITSLAFFDLLYYKSVVMIMEKYIEKVKAVEHIVSGIYIIDSILKHSRETFGFKDRFAARFEIHILSWLGKSVQILSTNNHYKASLTKVLKSWQSKGMFTPGKIDAFLEKLSDSEVDLVSLIEKYETLKKKQKAEDEIIEKKRPIEQLYQDKYDDTSSKMERPSKRPFLKKNSVMMEDMNISEILGQVEPKPKQIKQEPRPDQLQDLTALPDEILQQILAYLEPFPDLAIISGVCRNLERISADWTLWRQISLGGKYHKVPTSTFHKIFKDAHLPLLLHLNISYCQYLDDKSLEYAVLACPQLVSLDISACSNISGKGLLEMAKHTKHLQSLSLCEIPSVCKRSLKKILRQCLELRKLDLRCCHQAITAMSSVNSQAHNLEKLNISCYCMSGRIHIDQLSEILVRFPSLKKVKAVGVVAGVDVSQLAIGPKGETQNLKISRDDCLVYTIDLWFCAMVGNLKVLENLMDAAKSLKAPIKIDARGTRGRTPLMIAALRGHIAVIKYLIENKADTTLKDMDGNSAIGVAKRICIVDTLQLNGVLAQNTREEGLLQILSIVKKYSQGAPRKNYYNDRTGQKRDQERDVETILQFILRNQESELDCKADVYKLLVSFLCMEDFAAGFITSEMPYARRDLIRRTLGRDTTFLSLMPYMPLAQQQSILLLLSEANC